MRRSIREAAERTLAEAHDCSTLALTLELLEELGEVSRVEVSEPFEASLARKTITPRGQDLIRGVVALMSNYGYPSASDRLDTQAAGRVCATKGCETVLSRYNKSECCELHTKEEPPPRGTTPIYRKGRSRSDDR